MQKSILALAVLSLVFFGGNTLLGQWMQTNELGAIYVEALAAKGSSVFAGTLPYGVVRTTNGGVNWTPANAGLTDTLAHAFAVSGTAILAGTSGGVFLSTNDGVNWTARNAGLSNVEVFRSSGDGLQWTSAGMGLPNADVAGLCVTGSNLFAVLVQRGNPSMGRGVWRSTDIGTTWASVSDGLSSQVGYALAFGETSLFLSTFDSGVWRRPSSEIVASAEISTGDVPATFELEQNYPNPFNPSTTISFFLPHTSFVTLKVVDILGRETATLASEEFPRGSHSRVWTAGAAATGVYLYRLESGSFNETKKLLISR